MLGKQGYGLVFLTLEMGHFSTLFYVQWKGVGEFRTSHNNHRYGTRIHRFPQPITFRERKRLIHIFQLPNLSDEEWRTEWWLHLLKELQLLSV